MPGSLKSIGILGMNITEEEERRIPPYYSIPNGREKACTLAHTHTLQHACLPLEELTGDRTGRRRPCSKHVPCLLLLLCSSPLLSGVCGKFLPAHLL